MLKHLLEKNHAFWQAEAKNVRIETGLYIDGVYRDGADRHTLETVILSVVKSLVS